MKTIGFIYSSEQQLEELIKANELSAESEYLIKIHTCIHNLTSVLPFINIILSYFPNAKIIGSSTSGVIIEGKIMTNCCLVSITEFQNASVKTILTDLSDDSEEDIAGSSLADNIVDSVLNEDSVFMLSFFARPYTKINKFVEQINIRKPDIQVIGGVAIVPNFTTINIRDKQSFVFNEKAVSNTAIVCAVIDNKRLSVYSDIVYVTEPLGKVYTITDADGMIIRAVDGENAVSWYQNMLGINLNDMDSAFDTTIVFPIVKADRNNIPWAIAYSPQDEHTSIFDDEPEPVMYVLSEAKTGDRIRISYSSVQKTIETCENVCKNINEHDCEVLFGYSCVSRQNMFTKCAEWELRPFEKTNLCGALVAGEIGNIKNTNCYCNYSFAIASLSETSSKVKLNISTLHEFSGCLINKRKSIIDYLINNVDSEPDSQKAQQRHEIEVSLFMDDDTGLENVNKFLFDYNLKKFDKICMITIRNENLLKAFLSQSKFLIYFNRFHKAIIEFINCDKYNCYIYKKNSLILTANCSVTIEDFYETMEILQVFVADFKFSKYVPVSEFSIVIQEEDMIKKAELTLARMRSNKHCFLAYTPDLGLEQYHAQKMKMIMILNDAISNNRVVPYFQGIRDNKSGYIKMYEALMRIEDSAGNVYTPYQFMDIATEYGYYPDISCIMINNVMELFKNSTDKVTINMNISDIYNYKTVRSVLQFLKTAPHPDNYIFELTETEEIEDYQVIHEFTEKVHEAGGKIAIDDFGSGFSNIVNIFKIQSDYIKIDGEIIKNIECDVYALEFLEMISFWAKKHDKEIVAEFVENNKIQNIIEQYDIRFSQGYLYSKPARLFYNGISD